MSEGRDVGLQSSQANGGFRLSKLNFVHTSTESSAEKVHVLWWFVCPNHRTSLGNRRWFVCPFA